MGLAPTLHRQFAWRTMDPPALSRAFAWTNTHRNSCRHISVYGLLPTCKQKIDDERQRATCVYTTSRGGATPWSCCSALPEFSTASRHRCASDIARLAQGRSHQLAHQPVSSLHRNSLAIQNPPPYAGTDCG